MALTAFRDGHGRFASMPSCPRHDAGQLSLLCQRKEQLTGLDEHLSHIAAAALRKEASKDT